MLKLKFGAITNLNMKNSIVMFTFSVFHWKYPYWANFFSKFKIILISWNWVQRLVPLCRIQWCYSLLLLYIDWKYPFWVNSVQKIKIVGLSWDLVQRLIRIRRIPRWLLFFSIFFFLDRIYHYWANSLQKTKIVSWSWNLVTRLIRKCCCSFYLFIQIPFLRKSGPKTQNCQFKLKF